MLRRIYRPEEVAPQSLEHSVHQSQATGLEPQPQQATAEKDTQGDERGYYCTDCGAGPFDSSQRLAAHVRWAHRGQTPRPPSLLDRLNHMLRLRGD